MAYFNQSQLRELEQINIKDSGRSSEIRNPAMTAKFLLDDSKANDGSSASANYSMPNASQSLNNDQIISKLVDIERAILSQTSASHADIVDLSKTIHVQNAKGHQKLQIEDIKGKVRSLFDPLVNAIKDPIQNAISAIQYDTTTSFSRNRNNGDMSISEIEKQLSNNEFQTLKLFSSQVRTSMSEVLAFRKTAKQISAGVKTADEQKVKLLGALLDVNRYQGQELIEIRNSLQQSNDGNDGGGNSFDAFGEMQLKMASKLAFRGIKLLLNPIETFYNKPKAFFEKLKVNNANEMSPIELLKKAGLHISDENKAFTFLGTAFPDISQETNTILNRQLDVQKNIYSVMSDIKVLLGGEQSKFTSTIDTTSKRYDALTGEFLTDGEFKKRQDQRVDQITDTANRNKNFLQKAFTTEAGDKREKQSAVDALQNRRKAEFEADQSAIEYKKKRADEADIVNNTIKIADALGFQATEKIETAKNSFDQFKNEALVSLRKTAESVSSELASKEFKNNLISSIASSVSTALSGVSTNMRKQEMIKARDARSSVNTASASSNADLAMAQIDTSQEKAVVQTAATQLSSLSDILKLHSANDDIQSLKVMNGPDQAADSMGTVIGAAALFGDTVSSVSSATDAISRTSKAYDDGVKKSTDAVDDIKKNKDTILDSSKSIQDRALAVTGTVNVISSGILGLISSVKETASSISETSKTISSGMSTIKHDIDNLAAGHPNAEKAVSKLEAVSKSAVDAGKSIAASVTDVVSNTATKLNISTPKTPIAETISGASDKVENIAKQAAELSNTASNIIVGSFGNTESAASNVKSAATDALENAKKEKAEKPEGEKASPVSSIISSITTAASNVKSAATDALENAKKEKAEKPEGEKASTSSQSNSGATAAKVSSIESDNNGSIIDVRVVDIVAPIMTKLESMLSNSGTGSIVLDAAGLAVKAASAAGVRISKAADDFEHENGVSVIDAAKSKITTAASNVKSAATDALENAKKEKAEKPEGEKASPVSSIISSITTAASNVKSAATDALDNAKKEKAEKPEGEKASPVSGIISSITTAASDVKSAATDALENAKKEKAEKPEGEKASPVSSIISSITTAASNVKSAATDALAPPSGDSTSESLFDKVKKTAESAVGNASTVIVGAVKTSTETLGSKYNDIVETLEERRVKNEKDIKDDIELLKSRKKQSKTSNAAESTTSAYTELMEQIKSIDDSVNGVSDLVDKGNVILSNGIDDILDAISGKYKKDKKDKDRTDRSKRRGIIGSAIDGVKGIIGKFKSAIGFTLGLAKKIIMAPFTIMSAIIGKTKDVLKFTVGKLISVSKSIITGSFKAASFIIGKTAKLAGAMTMGSIKLAGSALSGSIKLAGSALSGSVELAASLMNTTLKIGTTLLTGGIHVASAALTSSIKIASVALGGAVTLASKVISGSVKVISSAINSVIGIGANIISKTSGLISSGLGSLFGFTKKGKTMTGDTKAIIKAIHDMRDSIGTKTDTIISQLSSIISLIGGASAVESMSGASEQPTSKKTTDSTSPSFSQKLKTAVDSTKTGIDNFAKNTVSKSKDLQSGVNESSSGVIDSISGRSKAVKDSITSTGKFASSVVGSATDSIKNTGSKLFNRLKDRKEALFEKKQAKTDKDSNSTLHSILKVLSGKTDTKGAKKKGIFSSLLSSLGSGLSSVLSSFTSMITLAASTAGAWLLFKSKGMWASASSWFAKLFGTSEKAAKAAKLAADAAKAAEVAKIAETSKVAKAASGSANAAIKATKVAAAAKAGSMASGAGAVAKSSSLIGGYAGRALRTAGRAVGRFAAPVTAVIGAGAKMMNPDEYVGEDGKVHTEGKLKSAARGAFGADDADSYLGAAASTALKYSAYGAALGAVIPIPIVGSFLGGAIGLGAGAIAGAVGHHSDIKRKADVARVKSGKGLPKVAIPTATKSLKRAPTATIANKNKNISPTVLRNDTATDATDAAIALRAAMLYHGASKTADAIKLQTGFAHNAALTAAVIPSTDLVKATAAPIRGKIANKMSGTAKAAKVAESGGFFASIGGRISKAMDAVKSTKPIQALSKFAQGSKAVGYAATGVKAAASAASRFAVPLAGAIGVASRLFKPAQYVDDKGDVQKEGVLKSTARGLFGSDRADSYMGAVASTAIKYGTYGMALGPWGAAVGSGLGSVIGGVGHYFDNKRKLAVQNVNDAKEQVVTSGKIAKKLKEASSKLKAKTTVSNITGSASQPSELSPDASPDINVSNIKIGASTDTSHVGREMPAIMDSPISNEPPVDTTGPAILNELELIRKTNEGMLKVFATTNAVAQIGGSVPVQQANIPVQSSDRKKDVTLPDSVKHSINSLYGSTHSSLTNHVNKHVGFPQ